VVLAHDHAHLDQLLLVVPRRQRRPGVVADAVRRVQLVGSPQQGGVEGLPTIGPRAAPHPLDLDLGEPRGEREANVLGPLVVRAAVVPRAQDQELSLAGWQAPVEEHATEGDPPLEQPGVAHERAEDVQLLGTGHGEGAEQRTGALVSLVGGQRGDAGRCHAAIVADGLRPMSP